MLAPASPTANESLRDAFGIQCPQPDFAKFQKNKFSNSLILERKEINCEGRNLRAEDMASNCGHAGVCRGEIEFSREEPEFNRAEPESNRAEIEI